MMLPTPSITKLGAICNDGRACEFQYLEAHPEQDLALLNACEHDIGTPPGIQLHFDGIYFLLVATDGQVNISPKTRDWIEMNPLDSKWSWYGCVHQVALKANESTLAILGHYCEEKAKGIAALLTPPEGLFQLKSGATIGSDSSGDLFHLQIRLAGDDDDSSYHVRAESYESALEIATDELFAESGLARSARPMFVIEGGLIATSA